MSYFIYGDYPKPLGAFQVADSEEWFEYRAAQNDLALNQGLSHEIAGRYGKVYAQVGEKEAQVIVDIDDHGLAVTKTWKIVQHRVYEGV